MTLDTTLAYLAGFFDGEGCVYILRGRRKGRFEYGLEISFTGSDIAPLELAQEEFGGQITASKDDRNDRKPVFRLRLRNNVASDALCKMLPFLVVKRKRAELGIEFQSLVRHIPGTMKRRRLSERGCQDFKDAITALNDKVWNRGVVTT